ncbi:DUF4193 domain-containing protein [Arthrobacter sp. R4-81]
MATDYDAPRKSEADVVPESLDELQAVPGAVRTRDADIDEAETAEGVELPGADLSGLELTVEIIPPQKDEFVCSSCFLVRHRSQAARQSNGMTFCSECEG